VEVVEDGYYRRAGAIPLGGGCTLHPPLTLVGFVFADCDEQFRGIRGVTGGDDVTVHHDRPISDVSPFAANPLVLDGLALRHCLAAQLPVPRQVELPGAQRGDDFSLRLKFVQ
jgi:hypothetical protein